MEDRGDSGCPRVRRMQHPRSTHRCPAQGDLVTERVLTGPGAADIKRRPKAAYALPTLFTAGNIFLGYLSILRSFQGSMIASKNLAAAGDHFVLAAQAIG